MDEKKFLAEQFEGSRAHLKAVAYRMLGSRTEAEDAVQESWLRLSRADTSDVENLRGWLTTVVARVCLDMLRTRKSRREEPLETPPSSPAPSPDGAHAEAMNPEQEALFADAVGLALLVVLNRLTPSERIAFVLHDMFDLSFEEIAPIVERTPAAARQLASRARRRVRGAPALPVADLNRQRKVVDAFLAASRGGDFDALLAVLAPDVVFHADAVAARMGARAEIRGAAAVAETFKGRAQGALPALVDGTIGLLVAPQGRLRVVLALTLQGGRITAIEALADPDRLGRLDLAVLDA
ncbi:sigma-70 family RNA polymerase sigma factor [Sinorhizobium numidicum]|uniref:Sigma-70 family RNA polymerase sigma factor n=1 Tax=Sinorhizobium numidicum TaxID=680248 RepID=A0ABY8CPJ1_9HYPH|nr:sigma-70 family RNA polymerase sigma factor [Sinorhizobium numidicum]WEX74553.1 sigma-70 family RNA polymerase sigma factor [Sinorhizobium numidicum]WEX80544.1 sigma-70 family RNA polymerase sigma factor [Sinorhizobium numidicum]